jgi:hypothetical protein
VAGEFSETEAWAAAQRIEAWAGEIRVNLIRLVAIAALYGHHLLNVYLFRIDLPARYHQTVTAIAAGWTLAGLALHTALSRRWNPPWLRIAAVSFDATMIAALLLVSQGPRSPFLMLLFLLIGTAGLRLDLRLVWVTTILAILVYGLACGYDRWGLKLAAPDRVPRQHQVILVIGLVSAGVLIGQAVRQARRFARDFGDRLKPDQPA